MNQYPLLNSPIILGRERFRSRIFSAPMSGADITPDCCIGDKSRAFYELRAKGGAAAVTVSECIVHPQTDHSFMYHMDENVSGCLESFTYAADAIIRHGAIPSAELSHAGRYAGSYVLSGTPSENSVKYGPSDDTDGDVEIRELTKEQIADIVAAYGKSATFLKKAGFRMVMIHGGHGWLINQFLSPAFNHRTDEYGGCFANRARFMLEVIDAVRKAVGPGFPIEFRMSGAEYIEGGYDIDGGIEIAKAIDGKVDLIHVSAASHHNGFAITHPSMFEEHGRNVHLAASIKQHVKTPVATLGGLNDPEQMEKILENGWADVIYMGRALLADPYLPTKVRTGDTQDIRRCLRCFTCMAERVTTRTRRCAVNPLIGREWEVCPPIAGKRKTVLIAGGGVAGMQAAITAAERGHKVILCEKKDILGGILVSEQAIDFKYEMYQLSLTMKKQCEEAGVEIRMNTPVTPDLCEKLKPDALIVAVGSNPIIPPLPGIKGENVTVVNDYYKAPEKVGDRVVVLGGGLAGCECAVHLAKEGKQVSIVEMRDVIAPDANPRHRPILMDQLAKYSVNICTGYTGKSVQADGVTCLHNGEEVVLPCDSVICAVGQRANRTEAEALRNCAPFVREVGDVIRPANITMATYTAYHAALDLS